MVLKERQYLVIKSLGTVSLLFKSKAHPVHTVLNGALALFLLQI